MPLREGLTVATICAAHCDTRSGERGLCLMSSSERLLSFEKALGEVLVGLHAAFAGQGRGASGAWEAGPAHTRGVGQSQGQGGGLSVFRRDRRGSSKLRRRTEVKGRIKRYCASITKQSDSLTNAIAREIVRPLDIEREGERTKKKQRKTKQREKDERERATPTPPHGHRHMKTGTQLQYNTYRHAGTYKQPHSHSATQLHRDGPGATNTHMTTSAVEARRISLC